MQLETLVETSQSVAATRSRREKIRLLAELLGASPDDAPIAAAYLTGQPPQGRIGVGWAAIRQAAETMAAQAASLQLRDIDDALTALSGVTGAGSSRRRAGILALLFGRATAAEQAFLAGLLLGEIRQGALDGIMADAVARASDRPIAEVRRALMLSGRLHEVVAAAMSASGDLGRFSLEMFRPLLPMLAQTAGTPAEALAALGTAAFEFKVDGARIQIHRSGDEIRLYTRNLNEVTDSLPDIVAEIRTWPCEDAVFDAEAIALRDDGSPLPFQTTMRRFGRKLDVDALVSEIPLRCIVFDCLRLDRRNLIDSTYEQRVNALRSCVPPSAIVPSVITGVVKEADDFLERARQIGHEGVMAKALESTWDAGARGGSWLKIKPVHTLDLVVLAAEWGHGRRSGWLSNLHLGARSGDGWVMLGKTFKGLTDEILEWQTKALLEREVRRDGHVVHVRPELVVEIAFNDLQTSPRYPGGLALRFARVRAYRHDKGPRDADTFETVRLTWERQVAVAGGNP